MKAPKIIRKMRVYLYKHPVLANMALITLKVVLALFLFWGAVLVFLLSK